MGAKIFTNNSDYSAMLSRLFRLIGEVEDAIDIVKENHNPIDEVDGSVAESSQVCWYPGDLDYQIHQISMTLKGIEAAAALEWGKRKQLRREKEADNG